MVLRIALLVNMEILHETATYSEDDVASGLQNFLICVEMFFAALLHRQAFSHKDYSYDHGALGGHHSGMEDDDDDGEGGALLGAGYGQHASERRSLITNVMDSFNPMNDVMHDMKGVVQVQKAKVGLDHLIMQQWEEQQQAQQEEEQERHQQRQKLQPR